jgi:hypothetical protein
MAKRDNFNQPTKELLAKRVGYLCSNPDCEHHTIGPNSQKNKVISKGTAAHITAAAPGGPRYDVSLTEAQRMDASNGIWLCSSCAKIIDTDTFFFTVELLNDWKSQTERKVFDRILGRGGKNVTTYSNDEWNYIADLICSFINEQLFEVHRGALAYSSEITVIFGNDGYDQDGCTNKAKKEVEQLRSYLSQNKIEELGFGLSEDRYSWCLLAKTDKVSLLNNSIRAFWTDNAEYLNVQQSVSHLRLYTFDNVTLKKYLRY